MTILLVPNNAFRPHMPDPHFEKDALAAERAGMDVQLVNHDALVAGRCDDAVRRVRLGGEAIYRGWMMTLGQYEQLSTALAPVGVTLRTSPEQYRLAHELPGWYYAFAPVTPASSWTEGDVLSELPDVLGDLPAGAGVVKDYVKSLKHRWYEAMFLPDLGDLTACQRVVETFLAERGDDLVGGIVVRSFENYFPGEVRTWWVDGALLLVTDHPDTPGDGFPVPFDVLKAVRLRVGRLGNRFVTVDLAKRSDGVYRVVEVGDGQVSDMPGDDDDMFYLMAHLR